MEKHYRIAAPPEDGLSASSIRDRIYAEMPADKPDHPTCYEGEWVCSYGPCPMRKVRLRVKAFYHQHLPRLRCPLCLRTLVFRHWLTILVLQEVPAFTLAVPELRAPAALRRSTSGPSPDSDR
jgi:hypothetical protein